MVHGYHIVGISACSTLKNITLQALDVNSTEIVTQYCSGNVDLNQNILLLIEQCKVKKNTVIAFWDFGSTISLVCTEFVKQAEFVSVMISYDLTAVGGSGTTHDSTHTHTHTQPK